MKRIVYKPDYDCVVHTLFSRNNEYGLWNCVLAEVTPKDHHIPEVVGMTFADYLRTLCVDIDSTCTYGLFDCGDYYIKFRQSGGNINMYVTYFDYEKVCSQNGN